MADPAVTTEWERGRVWGAIPVLTIKLDGATWLRCKVYTENGLVRDPAELTNVRTRPKIAMLDVLDEVRG